MNKEELKELIRKELEEHLFAHPSKHKGGFAHPGSQPHVKDYKKNKNKKKKTREGVVQEHDKAKVLQAMLKAGSNKAEAQALLKKHYAYVDKKYRDVPASKKAEIIVTLAGTASEGAINERKIEYSERDLKNLAGYTDRNQHLEARSFIAQNGISKKLHKAYEALITLRDVLGHTPKGAEQIRQDLDKDLKKLISKDIKNWEEVWGNL
tara:strand:+ start:117491 stop:118114 length:624 start_codon:yes stop_codon:yes gene_type:complete